MLSFRKPTPDDKSWVDKALSASILRGCDYSFGQLYQWADVYKFEICEHKGGLFVKLASPRPSYLFPAGGCELREAIELLSEDARANGVPLRFSSVEEAQKNAITAAFPGQFMVREARDYFDYIYLSKELIELEGRKFHAKRNHISRFLRDHPEAVYEPITGKNARECVEMEKLWYDQSAKSPELLAESRIICDTLQKLPELGFSGGLIRAQGRPVAFSIGEPLRRDVYVIHFEKALGEFSEAYALINREFARANCAGYKYINREEDLGLEGLRRAKLSYCPVYLLKKYNVIKGGRTR